MLPVQQATEDYSFSVTHQARGGYVEYHDGEYTVKLEIEMLGVKPYFVVYTQDVRHCF